MKKPPPVANVYAAWTEAPQAQSERCKYWVDRIQKGWRPNRRIRMMGYDSSARFYGVYIWEFINVLWPLMRELKVM